MPALNKRVTDAAGKPINPAKLYTPIGSHGRGFGKVYNPEMTQLRPPPIHTRGLRTPR